MATYNARSISNEEQLEELKYEFKNIHWDIPEGCTLEGKLSSLGTSTIYVQKS